MTRSQHWLTSVSKMSLMTLLSRVTGLLRDMAWAVVFGASVPFEAFLLAFKIPNLMRRLFAEGAFSQTFVPILSDQFEQSPQEARQFVCSILTLMGLFLGVVTWFVCAYPSILISILAPGIELNDPRFQLACDLLTITFPFMWLISLSGVFSAVLNQKHCYALPASTPIILNLALLMSAGYLYFGLGVSIRVTAWSVIWAGVLQLLMLYVACYRQFGVVLPSLRGSKGLKRFLYTFPGAMFGASIGQLNIFADTVFLSFLPAGSLSWLYYADRIILFPIGVFAVSVSTVMLTRLSQLAANAWDEAFKDTLEMSVVLMSLLATVMAVGLIQLAYPLSISFFCYGKFTGDDAYRVYQCLSILGYALPAMMLVKLLTNAFYAKHNVKTPVTVGMMTVVINLCFNFYLIPRYQHQGLAWSLTISYWFHALVLIYQLEIRQLFSLRCLLPWWWVIALAMFVESQVLSSITPGVNIWLSWGLASRFSHLLMLVAIGLLTYLTVAAALLWLFRRDHLYAIMERWFQSSYSL